MVWFIFALILFAVAAISVIVAIFSEYKLVAAIVALSSAILGGIFLWTATFWTNGPGEAKIQVNTFDRTYSEEVIVGPQSGFKPAWVDFVDFDLSYQELVYAGGDTPPSYTGGTVNGKEITITVGGAYGGEDGTTQSGSTQGDADATFVYNLDPTQILSIYEKYPYSDSQARFTKAIVEKQVLNLARQQSAYTATEFRGARQAEAQEALLARLNETLGEHGVEFTNITFQKVTYADTVEEALKAVEVANQKQQEAEANLRATEVSAQAQVVEAKAKAEAQIAAAAGEAEANRLLAASLTPEVLQAKLIEAYDEGTVYVTDGSANLLLSK